MVKMRFFSSQLTTTEKTFLLRIGRVHLSSYDCDSIGLPPSVLKIIENTSGCDGREHADRMIRNNGIENTVASDLIFFIVITPFYLPDMRSWRSEELCCY